jgi:hypothetical protein
MSGELFEPYDRDILEHGAWWRALFDLATEPDVALVGGVLLSPYSICSISGSRSAVILLA